MVPKNRVQNPSKRGDIVAARWHHVDHFINPSRTEEYDSFRLGIVKGVARDGRPGKVEWLSGQYDWQKREDGYAGQFTDFRVAPRVMLRDDVTDDMLDAAVKGIAFKTWDDVRAALAPLRRVAESVQPSQMAAVDQNGMCTCRHYAHPHASRPDCADAQREAAEQERMEAPARAQFRTVVHLPGVIHLYGAREGRTECGESTYGSTVTMSREPLTCAACAALEPDVLRAIAS